MFRSSRLIGLAACASLLFISNFASSQTVNVWLTTDDRVMLLRPVASVSFSPSTGGTNVIVVDETQLYQRVEGFGASFTDTTGYVLNEVATPAARTNAMLNLFTRTGAGIGVSFIRNPMGASDLARYHYSYDDSLNPDPSLTYFSIAHDQADIIPLIQQALQLNPQLKIMANPWSPPGWMKDSGSMIGGALLPVMYTAFANYFVQYIQAYQAYGIPIHYVSLQNEPLYVPADYPGMSMIAATQTVVLRDYVLPALASNHLATQVLIYDHNWDKPDYPDTVFSDPTIFASSQVAGIAWHGYGGTPGAMLTLANKYPSKGGYLTEHSGGTWVADQVKADFEEITHVMRSGGKSYVKWNLAADTSDGPHAGGCGSCTPLVYVNTNTGGVSYSVDFYTLGHFSKFVLPGANRIYSGNGAGIVTAAFLNPDYSKALIAFNDTTNARSFQVQWGNRAFSYTLSSYAGASFTWTGSQSGTSFLNVSNQIQASSFHSVSGLQTEPTADVLGGYDVGYASGGDDAVYKNVDFSTGFTNIAARVSSAGSGGTVELHLDSAAGPLVGLFTVPVTGTWQTWQTITGAVSGGTGLHDLFLVYKGGSGIGNLNWFQFSGAAVPLPNPWVTEDIGGVGSLGSAAFGSGAFTITGSGNDIWNTADAFRFVEQSVSGTCEIRARVVGVQNTDPWAKAGVMLRDSTAPGAVNAAILVTPGNGVTFQVRPATGAATFSTVLAGVTAPRWVRLTRTGNVFKAYYSSDGNSWTQFGTNTSIAMSSNCHAGLVVTAHNNSSNCTAVLDNITVNQAPALQPIPAQTIVAGRTLTITNGASDIDVPPQTLSFWLLSGPAGAALDPATGLFTWRPTIAQSPSIQNIAVAVADNGVPPMSATQTCVINVIRPAPPVLGPASLTNGNLSFLVTGDAGPDYTIQVSSNLVSWLPVLTTNSPPLPWLWVDTNSASSSPRFYRALLGP